MRRICRIVVVCLVITSLSSSQILACHGARSRHRCCRVVRTCCPTVVVEPACMPSCCEGIPVRAACGESATFGVPREMVETIETGGGTAAKESMQQPETVMKSPGAGGESATTEVAPPSSPVTIRPLTPAPRAPSASKAEIAEPAADDPGVAPPVPGSPEPEMRRPPVVVEEPSPKAPPTADGLALPPLTPPALNPPVRPEAPMKPTEPVKPAERVRPAAPATDLDLSEDASPPMPAKPAMPAEPAPEKPAPVREPKPSGTNDLDDLFNDSGRPAAPPAKPAAEPAAAQPDPEAEPAKPTPAPATEPPAKEAPIGEEPAKPSKEPAAPEESDPFASLPTPHEPVRLWVDETGLFEVTGRLVSIGSGTARILKSNGRHTTVAFEKLSDHDRFYVEATAARITSSRLPAAVRTAGL